MHLIRGHDPDNTGDVGNLCSGKRAGPGTSQHIMDLNLTGMRVITNGTAGINSYVMQAHTPPGIFSCHQVPEKDPGKLRVRIPRQGFQRDCLSGHDYRGVPV